jgi:hypothetical protein
VLCPRRDAARSGAQWDLPGIAPVAAGIYLVTRPATAKDASPASCFPEFARSGMELNRAISVVRRGWTRA